MASTIKRRLSSVSGFYAYLVMTGALGANPVPKGIATRRRRRRRAALVPLLRTPRRLPKSSSLKKLSPFSKRYAITGTAPWSRPWCSAAYAAARCSACGSPTCARASTGSLSPTARAATSASVRLGTLFPLRGSLHGGRAASGGEDRAAFRGAERAGRGEPLSDDGLEEIVRAAKARAGLLHATCHELRHTCLTRLREAGMALEALQVQAGHRSIETTRLYLHLSNEWLSGEYQRAAALIDAQMLQAVAQ